MAELWGHVVSWPPVLEMGIKVICNPQQSVTARNIDLTIRDSSRLDTVNGVGDVSLQFEEHIMLPKGTKRSILTPQNFSGYYPRPLWQEEATHFHTLPFIS